MARKENKSKSQRIGKAREKESLKETRENDFESGDNPEERARTSGSIGK